MPRLVAIGDTHGEYNKLTGLLNKLDAFGIDFENEPLIFLGDYVDGGPHTAYVVDALIQFQKMFPHWVFLRGNHEQMLLDAKDNPEQYFINWYTQGGLQTYESYRERKKLAGMQWALADVWDVIPESHLRWFDSLPLYHETENFYFVHAGFVPNIPVSHCPESAMLWIRHDYIKSTYNWGKKVVSGHTPQLDVLVKPNKILIDTMRHGKGPLTAVVLNDLQPEELTILQSGPEAPSQVLREA